jgi:transposase
MTENVTELSRPLVIGRKRDGRTCYDPEAKRELVAACLRPGVSVARLALDHGINANLLRKWIDRYRGKPAAEAAPVSAFIPLLSAPIAPVGRELKLDITLANGIQAEVTGIAHEDVTALLVTLSELPCSASTQR